MKVGIIQSNYLPWKGYFDIINESDIFVFHDNIQYTKQDWRNRNYIKSRQGERVLLSVPVKRESSVGIIENVEIANTDWQRRHWDVIKSHYSSTPHFKELRSFFEEFFIEHKWSNLSFMNQSIIQNICDYLGVKTQIINASELKIVGTKTQRLISILQSLGASEYLSGPAAKNYIDDDAFIKAGIKLIYKSYDAYPHYTQSSEPFTHEVSIIDLMFQEGRNAPFFIWGHRT